LKKYVRIIFLLLLAGAHLIWILDKTGRPAGDDFMGLGEIFFPFFLPYALLAATLSLAGGVGKVEKSFALGVFSIVGVTLFQSINTPVAAHRATLLQDIGRQFHPHYSWAAWLFTGLCFQQGLIAVFRRKKYHRLWLVPFASFLLGYAALGYVYIISRIHPGFPLRSTLPDAVLVFALGSIFFGMLWVLILPFYGLPITVFPYRNRKGAQPEDRQLSSESAPCASSDEVSS
jgi:hypothetical protein